MCGRIPRKKIEKVTARLITHEPKFKIGDRVKTNDLYRRSFSRDEQIQGTVTKVEPCKLYETDTRGYIMFPGRIRETVILVAVGDHRTINQEYFEKEN